MSRRDRWANAGRTITRRQRGSHVQAPLRPEQSQPPDVTKWYPKGYNEHAKIFTLPSSETEPTASRRNHRGFRYRANECLGGIRTRVGNFHTCGLPPLFTRRMLKGMHKSVRAHLPRNIFGPSRNGSTLTDQLIMSVLYQNQHKFGSAEGRRTTLWW